MKLNLSNVEQSYTQTATLNANFDAIEGAIENTLSRDGTTPNEMNANIDMNSNDLLNVGTVDTDRLVLSGVEVVPSELVTIGDIIFNVKGVSSTGTITAGKQIYPGTPAGAQQLATGLLAGSGAPVSGGNNGDFYFRADGTTLATCFYQKRSGVWEPVQTESPSTPDFIVQSFGII